MASQKAKTVAFEVLSKSEVDEVGPRLGRLSVKARTDLETPNFLAVSSRGVVPHISPDVVSSQTQIGGVHLALEDCELYITCLLLFKLTKTQLQKRQ